MGRQIIYSAEFEEAVAALGSHSDIDVALETIVDALERNPYGFNQVENDFASARYAIIDGFGHCPKILVIFHIDESKNVILEHIEDYTSYL